MKIRILQCDPIDPQAEDQVHRIRHQTAISSLSTSKFKMPAAVPKNGIRQFYVPRKLWIRSWPLPFPSQF